MGNSSERPGEDGKIELLFDKRNANRIRPGKCSRDIIWAFNRCHAQIIRFEINARHKVRRLGILPGQASIAAADFQHALVSEVCKLMQIFSFSSFGVFLEKS